MSLQDIKHIVLILSGKGGVGKSSVTTQIALSLALQGHSVGVLDVDLTGPSIPRFFGIETSKIRQAPGGWIPVPVHEAQPAQHVGSLSCMSLGFLLANRGDAVVWRGPKKTAMIRQFLTDVHWGQLDYLLIDTPPGTSDEHISLVETLLKSATTEQLSGAVVVTTPQAISISDVKKEINFCRKVGVRVLGVIENMAGYVCPNCSECTDVFSKGGGEVMATEFEVPFLGRAPIDPMFVRLIEEGAVPEYPAGTTINGKDMHANGQKEGVDESSILAVKYQRCSLSPIFDGITKQVLQNISTASLDPRRLATQHQPIRCVGCIKALTQHILAEMRHHELEMIRDEARLGSAKAQLQYRDRGFEQGFNTTVTRQEARDHDLLR